MMKKTIIALSAIMMATPVFAVTAQHASDADVATAHEQANTAAEKLHQTQHQGEALKLKSEHAAEGKSDTLSSKISEDTQEAWHKTKEGAEKGWDATKEGTERGWDKTKAGAESLKNKISE